MCLHTKNPEIKIAEKDTIVFKKLDWGISPYLGYRYIKNELNPEEKLKFSKEVDYPSNMFLVFEGYHSRVFYNTKHLGSNSIFIIPKGASYIEGFEYESLRVPNYVSSNIIYKGKLTRFNLWKLKFKYWLNDKG